MKTLSSIGLITFSLLFATPALSNGLPIKKVNPSETSLENINLSTITNDYLSFYNQTNIDNNRERFEELCPFLKTGTYSSVEISNQWYFRYSFKDSNSIIGSGSNFGGSDQVLPFAGVDLATLNRLGLNIPESVNIEDKMDSFDSNGWYYKEHTFNNNNSPQLFVHVAECDSYLPEEVRNNILAPTKSNICTGINSNSFTSNTLANINEQGVNIETTPQGSGNWNSTSDNLANADNQPNFIQGNFDNSLFSMCFDGSQSGDNITDNKLYCDTSTDFSVETNYVSNVILQADDEFGIPIYSENCSGGLDKPLKIGETQRIITSDPSNNFLFGYVTVKCEQNGSGTPQLSILDNNGSCQPNNTNFYSTNGIAGCDNQVCLFTAANACTNTIVMWGDNTEEACWGYLPFAYSQNVNVDSSFYVVGAENKEGQASFRCLEGQWRYIGGANGATCN